MNIREEVFLALIDVTNLGQAGTIVAIMYSVCSVD